MKERIYSLEERQALMRDRAATRPATDPNSPNYRPNDGRSRKALRVRARVQLLSEVKPRLPEYADQRRQARFMKSRGCSKAYIANQLNLKPEEVDEMLERRGEEEPSVSSAPRATVERTRLRPPQSRELLRKVLDPNVEVTFVPAFAGEVRVPSDEEEAERRARLAEVRRRESRDAGERNETNGR